MQSHSEHTSSHDSSSILAASMALSSSHPNDIELTPANARRPPGVVGGGSDGGDDGGGGDGGGGSGGGGSSGGSGQGGGGDGGGGEGGGGEGG